MIARATNYKSEHGSTILVVDDTPTNIQILAAALKKQHEIMIATNGSDALELLQDERKPDLILLDVMMPQMDGYEVCRRIKQEPELSNIPIIFVTAKDRVEDQQSGFDLGAVDYITKPFDLRLVGARVAAHLRLKLRWDDLENLAMVDALTGIANRRTFDDVLQREYGRAARSDEPLAVLMIDVDNFKAYNDHYGHGAGDECLRRVAQALRAELRRAGDFIARYGGEEFCVILPNTEEAGALNVATRLRAAVTGLAISHAHSGVADHVTVSIGAAARRLSANSGERSTIHREADEALYAAKSQGRDRVTLAK